MFFEVWSICKFVKLHTKLHFNYSDSTCLYFLNISIFLKSNTLNLALLKCITDKAVVLP